MRIATWNVNSLRVRLAQVLAWLDHSAVDVLALQETKVRDEDFPAAAIADAGYEAVFAGQKTYNGVAVLARETPRDVVCDVPGLDDPDRRVLAATVGGTRVINLYVVNGQAVGSDKYAFKLQWLQQITRFVADELERHQDVVVLGDFNIAPADADVHDPEAWRGQILCSDEERAALGALLDRGLVDVFRRFDQDAGSFSWWDYRFGAFRRNRGLRIDLILASTALAGRCTACTVDAGPRQLERPSDHAPVIATFDRGSGAP